ncbi:MAG: aminodeoxychorismate synthase component I [Verrucomicrobiota bacterium]
MQSLELNLTPFEAVEQCRHLPGLVFFDSALETGAAISIIAASPAEIVTGKSERDWGILREKIASRQRNDCTGMPHGFAAGTVDYEGAFHFGFYEDLLVYRHADASWHSAGELDSQLRAPAPSPRSSPDPLQFTPQIPREQFCGIVRQAKDYIVAGDIYQVNLSQKFTSPWSGDPLNFYGALRDCSPAPYAAYLDQGGRVVLSSSPESFLKMNGREIRTRPIKGTRPRRDETWADEKSARELVTSPKEIAELIMITDLERNDLGQVCDYGSVQVNELLKLERYEQVFHLVSTVEGRLRPEVDPVTALRACFPGGSITGAPKKRAMEIISELEPVERGLYTGAIGWFGFNGESQFNIAIRTVILENKQAHFHVGAGIVADSDPEAEYEETLHKARGILLAGDRM